MPRHRYLRVLYSFPHPLGGPGIGTTALNQVRALTSAGVKVTLVCTSLVDQVPVGVKTIETLRIAGRRIPHRALGSTDRALAYHDRHVAKLLRRMPGAFDVVHVWPQSAVATIQAAHEVGCLCSREVPNTHTANAYVEAARESQIIGVPMHGDHSHKPDSRRLQLEEREYAEADILMVPSSHVAETFLAQGVDEARLGRHQYGYDPARFNTQGRVDSEGRPFTAVFVGSAEPRKGLHYALQAWISANPPKGSRFLVAGRFVHGYRRYIARWLDNPSIECLGFVESVPDLLRASDILLLPSVEEGSALVTYESQACGCIPIVSSAAGALLTSSLAGFTHTPRDVGALTRNVQELVSEPDTLARLRRDVIVWSANLTWDAAARRMVEIYEHSLSGRGLRSSNSP